MNHKGGVGKTCSASNVGACLANKGKKTLIIDLDPQANLSSSFGITDPDYSIVNVLFDKTSPSKAIIGVNENLDILPSTLSLCSAEMRLNEEPCRELVLKGHIKKIKGEYDFIVLDCPPALGVFTTNALAASTEVYIPLEPNHHAIRGVKAIMQVIETIKDRVNEELVLGGLFVTRYDKRKILDRDLAERMGEVFGNLMLSTRIRNNVSLSEAVGSGIDIFQYNNKCNGAADYKSLTEEILSRELVTA